MGQTLTHGVYLPDEGERNCYSGLAANWQILDTSVGTIAAHTAALAGKAPAVHTHTKSDITDFPAYGTTAGTICEGNDSRLSDARTPVAHTHTKSDVTDLFNSANEWADLQSYTQSIKFKVNLTIGAAPSSDLYGGFNFGNAGTNIGNITARVSSAGATYSRLYIGNKFTNGALDPNGTWKYTELQVGLRVNGDKYLYTDGSWRNNLLPLANNTYDLGSSTQKWKTLNGINPGALSLPDTSRVTDIDTTGWTFNGSTANQIKINNATQTLNGWLYIRLSNITATDSVIIRYSGSSAANVSFGQRANANGDPISITVPVVANVPTYVYATAEPSQIRFFLSLGEVNNFPS